MSYFAEMFCYGKAHTHIGITGIRNCYGMIYVGANYGYAIHIPYGNKDEALHAGDVFARFVRNNEGAVGGSGHLFGFINGKNWNIATSRENPKSITGEQLLKIVSKDMGSLFRSPPATLYRIKLNLGTDSGGFAADAAVIMIERVHANDQAPDGCIKLYKRENDIVYENYGSPPEGQYKINPTFSVRHRNPANLGLAAGWHPINADTCDVINVN